jgi:RNA polymerase sigma-70 factor (ECF subfamily)
VQAVASIRASVQVTQADDARDLILRHRAAVYRVALRMLGDRHEAEDVAQDVLLQLVRTRTTLAPGSDEGAWAYSIAINRCRDILRSHRHLQRAEASIEELDREDPGPGPDVALDLARRERQVQRALQQLPSTYREVLVLRDLEGQPYRVMCEVLGLSETNLKARVIRARRALARALQPLKDPP